MEKAIMMDEALLARRKKKQKGEGESICTQLCALKPILSLLVK
jgi:hypothetical protein